jgi:hypothetical protein
MRVPLALRLPEPSLFAGWWPPLAVGLIWGAWSGTTHAAGSSDEKLTRLGFTFDPHAHDAAVAAAGASATADSDAPPIGVLRLPKYVVTDDRVRLDAHEILTPKARVEFAEQRFLSPMYQKTLGPLIAVASLLANLKDGWAVNSREALALYEDDAQKRRNTEMKDLTDLAAMRDPPKKKPADQKEKPDKPSKP